MRLGSSKYEISMGTVMWNSLLENVDLIVTMSNICSYPYIGSIVKRDLCFRRKNQLQTVNTKFKNEFVKKNMAQMVIY